MKIAYPVLLLVSTLLLSTEPNLPPGPIGAFDLIHLSVSNSPELSQSFRVDGKGMLNLPLLHAPIMATGLTPAALGKRIAADLRTQHLLQQPIVVVSVLEYLSRSVTVGGAVSRPVTIHDLDDLRLTDALIKAGGLLPQAGPEIIVTQKDGSAQRIEVRKLISGVHPELNLRIADGASITVPEADLVYVMGDVPHPGAFPLINGGDTTVLELLATSGGLDANSRSTAYVYRTDPHSQQGREIPLPLRRILEGKAPDIKLAAGDILFVSANAK